MSSADATAAFTCPHGKPPGVRCRLCELGVPAQPQGRVGVPAFPEECRFAGEPLSIAAKRENRLDLRKDWLECLHPRHPLGNIVCRCQGCGPSCPGYQAEPLSGRALPPPGPLWACGVTTVGERRQDLLPQTLLSLRSAGFPAPRLFVDGCGHVEAATWEQQFGLPVTARNPKARAFASWFLALAELYLREPHADRYAVFQDDLIACRNLRAYLDACEWPARGYLNLYTFPENQKRAPRSEGGGTADGWFPSNQMGKGAVGLAFCNEGCRLLLQSRHMGDRPHDPPPPDEPERPFKAIDGAVVSAFRKAGWAEWVHSPSLLQHVGDVSTLGNGRHAKAESWRGADWDAMSLLAR